MIGGFHSHIRRECVTLLTDTSNGYAPTSLRLMETELIDMTNNNLAIFLNNLPLAFSIVFGSFAALIGLLIAAMGFLTLRKWSASRHWPQVPARIVACEIREVHCFEDHIMFQPQVRYTFPVASGEMTGNDLAFANKLYPTRKQAAKAVSRFPVGMVVVAHYDPKDPARVVLMRRGGFAGLLLTGLGLAVIIGTLVVARQAGLQIGWLGAIICGLAGTACALGWSTGRQLSRARGAGIYPAPGRGSDQDVERLVRSGEKMLAIRLYRELHGTDLKTSRLRIEEMMSRLTGG